MPTCPERIYTELVEGSLVKGKERERVAVESIGLAADFTDLTVFGCFSHLFYRFFSKNPLFIGLFP